MKEIIKIKVQGSLINSEDIKGRRLKMFEEPDYEVFQPERSVIEEIPSADRRLKNTKTRVLKLLQQKTQQLQDQQNELIKQKHDMIRNSKTTGR